MIRYRWVVLKFIPWTALKADGIPIVNVLETKTVGFLPVFDTEKEAEKDYPDCHRIRIEEAV